MLRRDRPSLILYGDLWFGLAQRLTQIIFWFHPFVHILNSHIALAREKVCDNYALACTKPADYAQALFDVASSIKSLLEIEVFDLNLIAGMVDEIFYLVSHSHVGRISKKRSKR